MVGRLAKRVALLAFCGVGLSLASCSSTGFAGDIYTSPDNDGKRTQSVFFSDYVESPMIYAVIPIVSGRKDETLTISVKVFDVLGTDVTAKGTNTFPDPIVIAQIAPGVQTSKNNVVINFPDPAPVSIPNPADPFSTPLTVQLPRAVGHFEFIASMNGDTEAVKFEVINPSPAYQGLPTTPTTPPPGTCVAQPPPNGNIEQCPMPSAEDQSHHKVVCCTGLGVCGTGVENTGLCE
ncbi:MAG: hypothetical protein ABI183_18550 [Polyangiaceae bacterium]